MVVIYCSFKCDQCLWFCFFFVNVTGASYNFNYLYILGCEKIKKDLRFALRFVDEQDCQFFQFHDQFSVSTIPFNEDTSSIFVKTRAMNIHKERCCNR